MNLSSFRYRSLKYIISLYALSQLYIYKISLKWIYIFTAYANICAYTQFPNHTGCFYGCFLHLYFISLPTFTSHFLLNKECKPSCFLLSFHIS